MDKSMGAMLAQKCVPSSTRARWNLWGAAAEPGEVGGCERAWFRGRTARGSHDGGFALRADPSLQRALICPALLNDLHSVDAHGESRVVRVLGG